MRLVTPAVGTAAGLALMLSACASTRDVDTRLPAAYEAPSSPAIAAAPSLETWWTGFNDPQLTALITEALANSPDARSAAAKLREARATRSGALTSFLPQGNPRGSITETDSK